MNGERHPETGLPVLPALADTPCPICHGNHYLLTDPDGQTSIPCPECIPEKKDT